MGSERLESERSSTLLRGALRTELIELIPALRAFARTFSSSAGDADDLVQETLLKGIANIHQYRPGTSMRSWLFTIMRNTFYTNIKRYNREAPAPADCASVRPGSMPAQNWVMRHHDVSLAIRKLPAEQREVLILISMFGLSYLEAADVCECAMGTIKSRLNRARQQLADLAGEGDVPAMVHADEHYTLQ